MTISGMLSLRPDELFVLDQYRLVRNDGFGFLFIEFGEHEVRKCDVKYGGRVAALKRLLSLPPC